MEIFKEKGTIANIFTKLSISIAQFLLPFAIGFVAAHALPFRTIFIATAVIIIADGILLAFLPFPPFEKVVKVKGQKKEKMHFTPAAIVLVCLGFTTSTTFMLWMNCNQELGTLYGLADPSKIQSFYSVGIVVALFVSAALLKRNVEPAKILVIYPSVALATLAAIYFIQKPVMCLAGGFLLGFFAAGGVLQLVTAVANEMFPKNRGVITSIVMISSSVANYIVISVAGVLTRVGGANGPRLVVLFNMAVTLVGILLAAALGRMLKLPVIEMDQQIARNEGMTIPEIFAQKGEGHFRQCETALLEGLAAESTCLVSCGGGVAMRQENVAAMRRCGTVVLLTARPEVILDRVKDSDERPLLQGKKNVADIAALMAQRRGAYEAAADVTVATSDLTIEEVCRAVLRQVNET